MKQSTPRSLLVTTALLPTIFAQIVPLIPGMGMDPMDPMCVDDGVQTIIYEYPVFYSTVYESVGTIFSFLGGTNSLVINNPGQTIVTSTVLTTTVVSTSTTTATVTAFGGSGSGKVVTATLGAGIPSGTVQSIPSNSPFALAFAFGAAGSTPDGYAAGGGLGDVTDANYFFLEGGELPSTNGGKVGRNSTQSVRRRQDTSSTVAKIEASIYYNDITTDFFLVNGMLNWVSPDLGPATFYACPDGLYAGFPDAPDGTCAQALVGAVAQTAVDQQLAGDISTSSSDGSDPTTDGGFPPASDSGAAATSDSGAAATTDPGAAATSAAAGDKSPCPGQDPSDDYYGYSVYCGQAVDPVNPDDDLTPGGQTSVTSFDDCTILCDQTDGCTGLSYYAPDSTCYIHSGESQDPVAAPGYDSAIKNDSSGDDGGDSSSTTSTMSQDSSATSGDGAAMTSDSGMSTSGSAESTPTSSSMSSGMTSSSFTSATGSAGSSATSSPTSSSTASSSSASGTGSVGSNGTSSAMSSSMTSSSATSSSGSGSMASASTSSMMSSSASSNAATSSMGSTVSGSSSSFMSSAMSSSMASSSALSGTGSTQSMGTSSTTSKSPYSNSTSSSVTGGITTPASSTMSGIKTTTSSSPSSTTSTDICPTPSGSVVGAYSIYCDYVVDPVGSTDYPLINPISFQGCLDACSGNSTCVGLSYYEASTACYLHGGQNQAPAARGGWRGAIKVGTGGPSSTTTTTTTTPASSTMTSVASTSSVSTSSASSSITSSSSTSTPVATTPGVTTPNLLATTSSTSSTTTSSGSSSGSSSTSRQSTTTTSTSSALSSSPSTTTTTAPIVTTPGVTTPNLLATTTSSTTTSTSSTTMVTPNVSTSTSTTTIISSSSSSPSTTTTPPTTTTTTMITTTTSSAAATTTAAVGAQDNPNSDSYKYCIQNCPSSSSQVQNGYRVYQGTQWGGTSFANSQVASFTACLSYCSSTSDSNGLPCVGVNFNTNSGFCYLHNDCHNAETETQDTGLESGEKVSDNCPAYN